ncbi:MAG: DUF507 family protein [bacterium]|nr:DUF507 family protein [bacterium]
MLTHPSKTRLSDERIESIANQIIANLIKKKLIAVKNSDKTSIVHKIVQIIAADQKLEEEIESETLRILKTYEQKVAPGTPQWQVVFNQTKERIAKKKGFIL